MRVRRLIAPFIRFVKLESASSIVLLLATVAALLMANFAFGDVYEALTGGAGSLPAYSGRPEGVSGRASDCR